MSILSQIMSMALFAESPMMNRHLLYQAERAPLREANILEEFKLIKQKWSKLSAREREKVVLRFYRYYPTHCRVCGEPHRLRDEDAGSDRECLRVCERCYVQCAAELAGLT